MSTSRETPCMYIKLNIKMSVWLDGMTHLKVSLAAVLRDFAKQWLWDRLHFLSMDSEFVYSRVFVEYYRDKICNEDWENVS